MFKAFRLFLIHFNTLHKMLACWTSDGQFFKMCVVREGTITLNSSCFSSGQVLFGYRRVFVRDLDNNLETRLSGNTALLSQCTIIQHCAVVYCHSITCILRSFSSIFACHPIGAMKTSGIAVGVIQAKPCQTLVPSSHKRGTFKMFKLVFKPRNKSLINYQ